MQRMDFTQLKQELREFCLQHNVSTIYLQPGNAGDALISSGTNLLFEHMNLAIEPVDNLDFAKLKEQNQTGIIFSGGGVLNQFYDVGWKAIKDIKSHGINVFMLPCTISFEGIDSNPFDKNDILFLREKTSFDLCERVTPSKTFLADDLALYPTIDDWMDIIKKNINLVGYIKVYKTILTSIGKRRFLKLVLGQNIPLNAYRYDCESLFRPFGLEYNIDVSNAVGQASQISWAENYVVSAQFLFLLSRFKTVRTDRLHVAIGSFILSIDCELRSGAYWKNKAVFEHSITTAENSSVRFKEIPQQQSH